MIIPAYRIGASAIPAAGQGLFLQQPAARGAVLVAPDRVHTVLPEAALRAYAEDSIEVRSSVRWFESWYSITPEWSDECYVNHSFAPSGLWHLGFIFALRELPAGTELTIDYRLVIGSGEVMPFRDAHSGAAIVGLPWEECLRESTRQLAQLLGPPASGG